MKPSTARRVIRYPVLQIAELGTDDDGGIHALAYLVTDDLPEWDGPIGPPSLPRPEPANAWVTVAAIGLVVWGMLGAVGFVEVVKWIASGG